MLTATRMVNLAQYPIDDLARPEAARLVAESCRSFAKTGLCILPAFIRPEAIRSLVAETSKVTDRAYYCRNTHNAYLEPDNAAYPPEHPRRRRGETFVGSIAYDLFPEHSALRELYGWDPLKDFIAAVLDKPVLYRFADPLGACSVNVFRDGGRHAWHFDEAEFTVTLMLQAPERGGSFEYVPGIRGRDDEYEIVDRVMDGHRDGVVELPFTPGTLLIFGGRNTLHRVTDVTGDRPRLVPVLCYSVVPNLKNSDAVRKLFWGRTGKEATV